MMKFWTWYLHPSTNIKLWWSHYFVAKGNFCCPMRYVKLKCLKQCFIFSQILWFGNFGNFWKTIANFFLTFTLYKWKLKMFLDFFVATMIQDHFCKCMKSLYYMGTYKNMKNGLQTCIKKLTIGWKYITGWPLWAFSW